MLSGDPESSQRVRMKIFGSPPAPACLQSVSQTVSRQQVKDGTESVSLERFEKVESGVFVAWSAEEECDLPTIAGEEGCRCGGLVSARSSMAGIDGGGGSLRQCLGVGTEMG